MFKSTLKCLPKWFIVTSRPNVLVVRSKSKSSESNPPHPSTAKLKRLFTDNKLLYGPVLKKKTTSKKATTAPVLSEESDPNEQEPDKTSEIFWLMEHKPDVVSLISTVPKKKTSKKNERKLSEPSDEPKKVKKAKTPKQTDGQLRITSYGQPKPPKKSKSVLPESLVKFTESLIPIPLKIEKIATQEPPDAHQTIPFTAKDLKSMLNYPLFEHNNDEFCKVKSKKMSPTFSVPSVSRILSATMPESSRRALENWKTMKIAELGLEGFENLQREHFSVGKNFHLCLQKYFETGTIEKESTESELWKSVGPALEKFQTPANLVETYLTHATLQYKGIVDCITVIDNTINIIEWKKSDRLKGTIDVTYDAPIQLTAYLGALMSNEKYQHLNVRNGVVVVGYTNGLPANVHRLSEADLIRYWRKWLGRLQEYWIRLRDNTLPENL